MEEKNKATENDVKETKGKLIDDDVVVVDDIDNFVSKDKDSSQKDSEKVSASKSSDNEDSDAKEYKENTSDNKPVTDEKEDKEDKPKADKKADKEDKPKADSKDGKEDKSKADSKDGKEDKSKADKKEDKEDKPNDVDKENKKIISDHSSDSDKKDSKNEDKTEKDKKNSSDDESGKGKENASSEKSNADNKDKKEENKSENKSDNKGLDIEEPKVIETPKKQSGGKKGILIGLGTVAGLLLIAYISGFVYFSNHFYKDVTVNGINVSNMSKETAKNTLDSFYKDYTLTLKTIDDKEIVIDGKDISAKVNLHDEFSKRFADQKPALWFVNMFHHHDYNIGADASWDDDMLEEYLDGLDILQKKNMVKPEDAYVGVVDGKFQIVKEVMGSTIKEKEFNEALKDSLSSVQSKLDLVEAECYELPKVYSDDEQLKKDLDAKNEYAKNDIIIQMDDLKLEPGMELYEDVLEKSGDKYSVSKTKVTKYVNDLANQYDSVGKDREFTTSFNGRKIKTTGTAFGYELDKDATTDALYKALTAGKPSTVEAVFISKGKSLVGDSDIGNTYVEVNLSEQKVIGYKNGKKIAEGDCVSGNESAGHGTSTGLYAIQEKLSPTVLRGEKKAVTKTTTKKNKKGKKVKKTTTSYEYEYESPVTYWMQFNGGQGLHDAAGWRSSYGGSIYYYSGSHGCVNLPLDLAKTLYENFEVGDPVIVYFWDNENRK